jgi:hypothetical protein
MIDYFKENPSALMDALPTPREGNEEAFADFRTG